MALQVGKAREFVQHFKLACVVPMLADASLLVDFNGKLKIIDGKQQDGESQTVKVWDATTGQEVFSLRSFHASGTNVVMADGSVHFLKAGMSIRVLGALVIRAGGEVVSHGDF